MNSYFSNTPVALNEASFEAFKSRMINNHEKCSVNKVAIISVHGVLTKKGDLLDFLFATSSYENLEEEISCALKDPDIEQILLEVDSPGGEVNGLFEFCDFLQEAKKTKPIHAIVCDVGYSAAYAIVSCCTKVYLSRTGGVGSIGVICEHTDMSISNEKKGVKVTSIYAGSKKNDLSPHHPLTERALSDLQSEVNRLYGMFVALVSKNRNVSEDFVRQTEAGTFFGDEAVKVGLVDEICDYKKVLEKIMEKKQEEEKAVVYEDDEVIEGEALEQTVNSPAQSFEAYRDEILDISKICKLTKSSRFDEFIEKGFSLEMVKSELLAAAYREDKSFCNVSVGGVQETNKNLLVEGAKKRSGIVI